MSPDANANDRPPNIIFVLSDQHRYDALGCAGHPVVQTPNLDRLAREGVRFSRMWCQSPICQPSRASIITGRYVHDHGVLTNQVMEFDPEWDTMMKALQRAGYVTVNVGKTHYYQRPLAEALTQRGSVDTREFAELVGSFGFDVVFEEFDRYAHALPQLTTAYTEHLTEQGVIEPYREQIRSIWRLTPTHWNGVTSVLEQRNDLTCFLADAAIDWIERHDGGRPFFMQLSFVQPHVPLMADPEWSEHYAGVEMPLGPRAEAKGTNDVWEGYLSNQRQRSNSQLLTDDYVARGAREYYGMISLIDQRIGDVLDVLTRKGWAENTWIVYASDHGEMLGDHSLMGKSVFYAPSVGVPAILRPPNGSLPPTPRVVDDPVELIDITATVLDIAGATLHDGAPGRSLVGALRGEAAGRETVFSAIGKRGTDELFVAAASNGRRCTIEWSSGTACELFDLDVDPNELHNLVDDPGSKDVVEEFRERIAAHMGSG